MPGTLYIAGTVPERAAAALWPVGQNAAVGVLADQRAGQSVQHVRQVGVLVG